MLPGEFTVSQVSAAVSSTLRSRGYVIVTERVTEGESFVEAGQHRQGLSKHWERRLRVRIRDAGDSITLRIQARPRPDRAESANVLDEMLATLRL